MHERVFYRARKGGDEDFAFGVGSEGGRETTDEYARVGADRGLGIELSFCEVT